MKSLYNKGLEPIIIKIKENLTEQESFDEEIRQIWVTGRKDLNMGPLLNRTWGGVGGDCISNHPNRKDIIRRMSLNRSGEKHPMFGRTGENSPIYGHKGFNKGMNWYNDGEIEDMFYVDDVPDGWFIGRLPKPDETKKKISKSLIAKYETEAHPNHGKGCYNNGEEVKKFKEGEQPEGWIKGKYNSQKKEIKENSLKLDLRKL